tara:strand:+ start:922 stop:1578 length:657 start_codon:yes stop_codon:yes gene_type:complete
MSNTTSTKVLLGTTLKQLNKAKLTGNLCMTELYLLNVINGYIYDCKECALDYEVIEQLKKLARNIQTKTSYICNIRSKPENSVFKFNNTNINNFFGEMATFNINIDAQQNLPPSIGDGARSTSYNTAITFTVADFTTNTTPAYSDPDGDAAKLLKILTIPSRGALKLNGNTIKANDIIEFKEIASGLFIYVPDAEATSAQMEPFTFAIADEGSLIFSS